MRTLAMSAGQENQIVWVIRINMDDGTYVYFADSAITLSGITFSGSIISYGSMSEFGSDTDVLLGGGIGSMDHFSFALSRYTVYNDGVNTLQSFFNDWYPATGKPVLTSKEIDLGLTWNTATNINQVTWLKNYRVSDYSYNTGNAFINCIEPDELSGVQIPRYKTQNKTDNGISYTTETETEKIGLTIPVLYGDFASLNLEYEKYRLAPTIQFNSNNDFKICSHICHTVDAANKLYMYVDKVETMMGLAATSPTNINTRAGHRILLNSRGSIITGDIKIIPRAYLPFPYGGTDLDKAIDKDANTYGVINVNTTAAFKFGTDFTLSELGEFSGVLNENILKVLWDSNGGNVNFQIKYYHPQMGVNSGYSSLVLSASRNGTGFTENYEFGEGNYNYALNPKKFGDYPGWDPQELQVIHFDILNLATSTGTMRIKHLYFQLDNLSIYFTPQVVSAMRESGGRKYPGQSSIKSVLKDYLSENKIFAYAKGYIYDNWID